MCSYIAGNGHIGPSTIQFRFDSVVCMAVLLSSAAYQGRDS